VFAGLLFYAFPAFAQTHVAIVQGRAALKPYQQAVEGIRQGLGREGDPQVDIYDLNGDVSQGPQIAGQIKQKNTKLVFTVGTEAFQAMKGQLNDLPIIMTMVYDPVGEGLADEHSRGAYLKVSFDRQFSMFRKLVPPIKKLAMLYPKNMKRSWNEEARSAAAKNGMELALVGFESLDQFSAALEEASKQSQMLVMVLDQELYNSSTAKELLLFSARNKYPIAAIASNYVKAGALFSISADYQENGITAGKMGAQMLSGITPSEAFVATERLNIAWNKRIADLCSIPSPPSGQVDEIY